MGKISDVEIVRLNAIASLMDDVQENSFNLDYWVEREAQPAKTRFFGLFEVEPACGFAGCAIGWTIHTKTIPGLYFGPHHIYATVPKYEVDGEVYTQFAAVAKALGINIRTAEYFFASESYKTRATTGMVSSRIRRFVAKIESRRERDRLKANAPLPEFVRLMNTFNPTKETV